LQVWKPLFVARQFSLKANNWNIKPPKIKELVRDLEIAGFVNRGCKGSHRNYKHQNGSRITISGQLSDDAKPYQIR
jgi:predicted RNA binding protein YcfA (HicA-like mRNA interferase family)